MPTAIEYAQLLALLVFLQSQQAALLTEAERAAVLMLLANNGFYFGDGGASAEGSAELTVLVAEDAHQLEMTGTLRIQGAADVVVVYNDRVCPEENRSTLGCKIPYPNKHKTCFQAGYFSASKRSFIPQGFASTGAYLPAITSCHQYLYLPDQTRQDQRKGPYTPPR